MRTPFNTAGKLCCRRSARSILYEQIYTELGLHYSVRWQYSPVEKAAKLVKQVGYPKGRYIVVHDSPNRGIVIDPRHLPAGIRQFRIERTDRSILSYCNALANAAEIHCVDSSVRHLCEQLPLNVPARGVCLPQIILPAENSKIRPSILLLALSRARPVTIHICVFYPAHL
jgi:hypothetical protein